MVGGVESFIDLSHQAALEEELRRQAADLEETVHRRTAELEAERTQLRTLLDAMADLRLHLLKRPPNCLHESRHASPPLATAPAETCHQAFYGSSAPCEPCPLQRIVAEEACRQEQTLAATGRLYDIPPFPPRARMARC